MKAVWEASSQGSKEVIGHEPFFRPHPLNTMELFLMYLQPKSWEEVRTLVINILNLFLFSHVYLLEPKKLPVPESESISLLFPPSVCRSLNSSHSFPGCNLITHKKAKRGQQLEGDL